MFLKLGQNQVLKGFGMIWRPESESTYKTNNNNIASSNLFFDGFFENCDFWAPGVMKNYPRGPSGYFRITPGSPGV